VTPLSEFNSIQKGLHQRMLTRAFRLRSVAPAPILTPEVQPVAIVENLSVVGPYSDALIRRASAFGAVAAVAAQVSMVSLQNPPGSGTLAVVRAINASRRTAGAISLIGEVNFVTNAGGGIRIFTDSRVAAQGTPVCNIATGNTAGTFLQLGGGLLFQIPSLDNVAVAGDGFVLAPGSTFLFQSVQLNVDFDVAFLWDEFVIEEP
jgi:hypothetical protein